MVRKDRAQWREERENQARQQQRTKKEIFRRTVEELVHERFVQEEPADSKAARKWRKHTENLRRDLVDELTHRHWPSGTPGALDWIIQLRAKEIGRQRFDDLQIAIVARSRRMRRRSVVLGCLLIACAAFRIIPTRDPEAGVWACLLLGGGVVVSLPAIRYYARLRLHRHDKERYEADLTERDAWQRKVRAKRPRDAEMARWYDLDQRFLRRQVLGEHQMEHRDILFSFFLVEGVAGGVQAKVRNGPPRYSHYLLTFYVLTSSGVWVSSWTVDFATGEHEGRQDTVFRYDAISSVMLESIGVRFNDSERKIVSLTEEGRLRDVADEDGVVLREAMRLDLHNGQRLMARLENFELLSDPDEALGQLRRLALESSGITAGFRILTAMATEGMKWFELRRQRAHRAFVDSGHPGDGDRGVRPPAEPPVLVLSDQSGNTP
ncbi:hypothetical protein IHE56_06315 [Streptomyces sp. ID01-12c]|uniref:hypothetical protein n=1 Tax=Streptomyces caniscabiei TaxID=2746961 RepID=UPI0017829693|nr:hypothetical protein [Streptomyces caniscabiei]MBD9701708.1 hypothetical protein [Streptomyces caniscabiei]MDX3726404.1 hypothetical protein [Streptomyces caniscabiei]